MRTRRKIKLSFIGILLGMISSILMQTIVATVLPIVTDELGHEELYGWIFSTYMIASTITIPLFSNLSDIYGKKIIYLGGLLLFLIGSLLSGFSQTMSHLLLFRIAQGIGAGAVAPAAIAMISDLFTSKERVKMLGLLSAFQVLANIIGPLLGGFITDTYSWRWTFFINLPIGLIAFIFIKQNYFEGDNKRAGKQKVDYIGSLSLGFSLVSFIFFFQLQSNGLQLRELLILLFGLLAFIAFISQEKRHKNPIVSLELFKMKNVKLSLYSMLFLGIITYGMIAIIPLYGQKYYGVNAFESGTALLLFSVGIGGGGMISSSLTKYLHSSRTILFSWFLSIMGFLLLILANIYFTSFLFDLSFILLIGLGLGINLPIFLASSQNTIEENKRAVVGGLTQISRNVGGAVSVPLLANIIIFQDQRGAGPNSYVMSFLILTIVSITGLIVGLRFKKEKS